MLLADRIEILVPLSIALSEPRGRNRFLGKHALVRQCDHQRRAVADQLNRVLDLLPELENRSHNMLAPKLGVVGQRTNIERCNICFHATRDRRLRILVLAAALLFLAPGLLAAATRAWARGRRQCRCSCCCCRASRLAEQRCTGQQLGWAAHGPLGLVGKENRGLFAHVEAHGVLHNLDACTERHLGELLRRYIGALRPIAEIFARTLAARTLAALCSSGLVLILLGRRCGVLGAALVLGAGGILFPSRGSRGGVLRQGDFDRIAQCDVAVAGLGKRECCCVALKESFLEDFQKEPALAQPLAQLHHEIDRFAGRDHHGGWLSR
eukprot:comp21683_c0_seq1/m.48162 comp21683_c0_seq1/g.48162  ORF comp21683_c0_seq1/g.48162 comp21683_c0_seq1/m.48162 type:complete len:324 (+) comp21683_c0_seq1:963-1934(+)